MQDGFKCINPIDKENFIVSRCNNLSKLVKKLDFLIKIISLINLITNLCSKKGIIIMHYVDFFMPKVKLSKSTDTYGLTIHLALIAMISLWFWH